jgi:cell pole-organizing protein PopZ
LRKDGEQSVDQILRSIKMVIGRPTPASAPLPVPADEPVQDVLVQDLGDAGYDPDGIPPATGEDAPLIEDAVGEAMRESLASLSRIEAIATPVDAPRSDPLEDMVREMLRPMLKQWLDTNLPEIVEQVVQREVRRITGRR